MTRINSAVCAERDLCGLAQKNVKSKVLAQNEVANIALILAQQ